MNLQDAIMQTPEIIGGELKIFVREKGSYKSKIVDYSFTTSSVVFILGEILKENCTKDQPTTWEKTEDSHIPRSFPCNSIVMGESPLQFDLSPCKNHQGGWVMIFPQNDHRVRKETVH